MPWMAPFDLQGCPCCIQDTLWICTMSRHGDWYRGWLRPNKRDPLLRLALPAPAAKSAAELPAQAMLRDLGPLVYAADANCLLTVRLVPEPLHMALSAVALLALCVLYPRVGAAASLCCLAAWARAWQNAPARTISLQHVAEH